MHLQRRILVTGGSGFLGSHLCERLLSQAANVSNPIEFTILELASMIIDMTGSRSRIVHRPLPENDPRQRRSDISKAQEHLAWMPKTPLKEGLIRTIAFFEQLLAQNGVRETLAASAGK